MGLSKYRLAKDIGVPAQRIGDIVAGKRAITADTDLRPCATSVLPMAGGCAGRSSTTQPSRETMGDTLARIQRCSLPAEPEEPKQRARKTIVGLRSVRKGVSLGGSSSRGLIREGRR